MFAFSITVLSKAVAVCHEASLLIFHWVLKLMTQQRGEQRFCLVEFTYRSPFPKEGFVFVTDSSRDGSFILIKGPFGGISPSPFLFKTKQNNRKEQFKGREEECQRFCEVGIGIKIPYYSEFRILIKLALSF